jgi:protease-4
VKRSLVVAVGAVLLAATCLLGCVTVNLPFGTGSLEQEVVYGKKGPKILLIDVSGFLSAQASEDFLRPEEALTARVRQELELAGDAGDIRALLLRVDSPGGTVTASEILYDEIERFKQKHHVPVVVQMMGVAASGAYYVSMAGDQVRAYPTTVTGSIGVVMAGVNLSGLMAKLGIADQTLTTGPFKDAGSPLRPMRPDERAQLQSVEDDLFQRFLAVVAKGRPKLTPEQIRKLADGRVYSAEQALHNGLIDAIGTLPEAVDATKTAAGIDGDARVVVYHRPSELRENLFSTRAPETEPAAREAVRAEAGGPGFLYLWQPGSLALP